MEQWKDIPGYDGLYQASTDGRIRTCDGKETSNARYSRRVWKQRIMRQKYRARRSGGKSDARVCLWKDGQEHTHLVSRLIAITWCDGYQSGFTVNHIDGNPLNNKASNLEWLSLGDNIRDAYAHGIYSNQCPIRLRDEKGHLIDFHSMSSASRYLGKPVGYISRMLASGITKISGGYTIIRTDEG